MSKFSQKRMLLLKLLPCFKRAILAPVLDLLYDIKGAKLSLSFNIQVGSKGSRFVPRSKNRMFCTIRGTLKKRWIFREIYKESQLWDRKEIDWTNSCAKMASCQVTVSSCTFLIDATKVLQFASDLKTLGKKTKVFKSFMT